MSTSQQILLGNAPTGGYQIERSLRFNSADSAYLNRTPASASNRKTYSFSGWVKRSLLSSNQNIVAQGNNEILFRFNLSDYINFADYTGGSAVWELTSSSVYRDVSAWYHIVFAVDTTQATSTNRVKVWVNNQQVTFTGTYPSQNSDTPFNTTNAMLIGNRTGATQYFNGYLTEINFIDGSALDPTSFGEYNATTGVWQPKAYTGSYGTNGFYLNFSDNSGVTSTTLGADSSGNGNNWTPNNFSVTAGAGNDSLVDTPTPYGTDTGAGGEVRGNYATWNPLRNAATLANGNLDISGPTNGVNSFATVGVSSGKWYWEVTVTSVQNTFYPGIGVNTNLSLAPNSQSGADAAGYMYLADGQKFNSNSATSYGASYTTNDVIGVALDMDAGTITFYKNGSTQGQAFSGITGTAVPVVISWTSSTCVGNFGQRPFSYTAPSGFKALVTTNLPTPTVVQGDDYFNTILYTGTGSSNARTGVGFQPDLVWIKERNASADHALYDAVRGVQQQLESNTTTDETTESTGLTAFGSDGFTVGSLAQVNTNNDTYVAWCWKESTTSKFDIVTYTGNGTARTISHNLGVVPNMIIVKARTTASTDQGWPVYHSANTANPETDYLLLNTTAATADLDTVWNDTAPTSSVFSVGTNALVNANNDTYVAYLFANVAGFSAFGSYTGNGSTDGPFVYTGFRPAFVITKCSSTTARSWSMKDSTRSPFNVAQANLSANYSDAEGTTEGLDLLSNGFKARTSGSDTNTSGETYIYMAFAENPFKLSLAR